MTKTMKRALSVSTFLLVGAFPALAGTMRDDQVLAPTGKGWGEPNSTLMGKPTSCSNGICYYGGPVIAGTTNVYYIWYGNWSAISMNILTDFAKNVGGSPYFNINTTYYMGNGKKTKVSNSVAFVKETFDNYSQGTTFDDGGVQAIVNLALTSGALPTDTNAVYFVLTSADVNEIGFCSSYCGWHTHATLNGADIKYALVGNTDRCPGSCSAQAVGPNGDGGADGAANVLAHELEEAVTDPDLNAWFDIRGRENADKCAWTFGAEYTAANGARANMKLGARDFLIQQNWVNASGGYCATGF